MRRKLVVLVAIAVVAGAAAGAWLAWRGEWQAGA